MRLTVFACSLVAFAGLAAPALGQGFDRAAALERLQALDTNGDGAITRAEVEVGRAAMFARMDANNDSYLSEDERRDERQRRGGGGRVDADGDGRISRSEFMNQPTMFFDRLDSNADGVISSTELGAVRGRAGG